MHTYCASTLLPFGGPAVRRSANSTKASVMATDRLRRLHSIGCTVMQMQYHCKTAPLPMHRRVLDIHRLADIPEFPLNVLVPVTFMLL